MADETEIDTEEAAPKRTRRRRLKPATESTAMYAGTLAKQVAALVNVTSSAELREKVEPLAEAIDGLESGAPVTTGGEALLARIAELGDQLSATADQATEHATARAALEHQVVDLLAVELEVIGALRRGGVLGADETPTTVELVVLMKRLRGTT